MVNPADIYRKGKERYTKTDRIDAQLISRELKDGRLEGILYQVKKGKNYVVSSAAGMNWLKTSDASSV